MLGGIRCQPCLVSKGLTEKGVRDCGPQIAAACLLRFHGPRKDFCHVSHPPNLGNRLLSHAVLDVRQGRL